MVEAHQQRLKVMSLKSNFGVTMTQVWRASRVSLSSVRIWQLSDIHNEGGMANALLVFNMGLGLLDFSFLFLYLYSHVAQPLQSLSILVQVVSLVVVPYLTFVIMK